MTRHALALNCGSSSLKYALFEVDARRERLLARDAVDRVGDRVPNHVTAARLALDELARAGLPKPDVIGHRIVHGGPTYGGPVRIDDTVMKTLRALVPFAPLHLPAELEVVTAMREHWPEVPQIACFDTSFHRTMPEAAQRYALPDSLAEAGVRRYGFHGLSYEYVISSLRMEALGRAVIAHLGSGASMVAVRDGRAVDTTMGLTPTGGLVMGSRPGDVDPGLLVYLLDHGYDARSLERLMNHGAGLRGLSGTTSDVRDLEARRNEDPRAALALDVFAWNARKWIGAMAATIGGLDTLVFTGGIGEHSASVRASIASGLAFLGIELDEARNLRNEAVIGRGACAVRVVSTDEERMIARHAEALTRVES
jgi:acetate kinase